MAKYQAKTTPSTDSVAEFLAAVPDPRRRADAAAVDALHRRATGVEPTMWGPAIVGYGRYDYRYESGHEGTAMRAGFSPRKAATTIYLMGAYGDRQADADQLFARLGKHKLGKSCLYIAKLADIDLDALEDLVRLSWETMKAKYPE